MIVIASANGDVGMDAAWAVLTRGGSALDAVEAGVREVESNAADHTVGYGGYPNLLGTVELDASIMDGTTRATGAVGALRGYRHAITVARAVMERLPHVLVVGDGAARLAAEIGLKPEDLLTDEAEETWRSVVGSVAPDGVPDDGPLADLSRLATDPERAAGTTNFIARDSSGAIASAVSTSGWAWKYPGRLGDTPVIGAGNYADGRYGAAACTGWGELAIRGGLAHGLVRSLRAGAPVGEACVEAVLDLADIVTDGTPKIMNMIAMDAEGGHAAVSTRPDARYVVRTEAMSKYEFVPREIVPI